MNKRTNNDYCELFQKLDKQYETTKASPLHHDNRCALHNHVKVEA